MTFKRTGASLLLLCLLMMSCTKSTRFERMSPSETGVDFQNKVTEGVEFNFLNYLYFYNGAGVAVADLNNDGLDDLFFTSNQEENRLYFNKGDFEFEDVTESAGIVHIDSSWSTGVSTADVNGDGWLDIYVSNVNYLSVGGRNQLFINNQDGTFTEQAEEYGLDFEGYSVQAAFFDYDRDDDLDMFLLNHSVHSVNSYQPVDTRKQVDPKSGDNLFRNDGGRFTDVSEEAGIFSSALGFGLGVTVSDINFDGWPDIYVGNDFHEDDYLYINQGDGTFINDLENYVRHTSQFTMSVDIADVNNDGKPDIATTDMLPLDEEILKKSGGGDTYKVAQIKKNFGYSPQYSRNVLQLNVGEQADPLFSEIGYMAGIFASDWSWSGLLVDLDNDGNRDFYIANGIYRRPNDLDYIKYISSQQIQESLSDGVEPENLALIQRMPELKIPNYVFRNKGDLTFENVSEQWGLDDLSFSNGAAYGDLDNDGDLDVVVSNVNQPAFLYRNDSSEEETPASYLSITLSGKEGNRFGIGTRIMAYAGGTTYYAEQSPVRGFQSSVSYTIHLGLGEADALDSLEVIWPDGRYQRLTEVEVNQRLELDYKNAGDPPVRPEKDKQVYLEDITEASGITAKHNENRFVDFDIEPLIPHYLSTQGPPLAVADVNQDGLEDFFMGNARGAAGQLWIQKSDGTFVLSAQEAFEEGKNFEDTDAEFVDINNDGYPDLFVSSGGGEVEGQYYDLQDRLYLNDQQGNFVRFEGFTPTFTNTGAMAIGDFDGDGDLDVFIGGRSVPGLYGYNPYSFLLQNDGRGRFFDITDVLAPQFRDVGMVTDAEWFDHDGDGDKDLILTGEWMAIRVFDNVFDQITNAEDPEPAFIDKTEGAGLRYTNGWWNTLHITDADGDGDEDIIAGNLGHNSYLRASAKYPLELYLNDYNDDQYGDPILTNFKSGNRYPVAMVDELVDQMSYLRKQYPDYEEYGGSTLEDIFAQSQLDSALTKRAFTFSTTLFSNEGGGRFNAQVLPYEAQLTPVYAVIAEDLTGNGAKDLYLAGNFYGVKPFFGNYDAGYGALFSRNEAGEWISVPLSEIGFTIDGEVRDMKPIELSDGRRGILISRNNETLKLVSQTY